MFEYVEEDGLVVVEGLVVVVERVFVLEGVTTVRVTVLLGFVVVVVVVGLEVVVGVTVREEVTVVVVVGFVVLVLFGFAGFVAEKSEDDAGVLEVVTLLVEGLVVLELTPELTGWAVISVGLFMPVASVRAPVTVGDFGVARVVEVELLLPLLWEELPAPVVPLARLS